VKGEDLSKEPYLPQGFLIGIAAEFVYKVRFFRGLDIPLQAFLRQARLAN
jgi:hypothetical protein